MLIAKVTMKLLLPLLPYTALPLPTNTVLILVASNTSCELYNSAFGRDPARAKVSLRAGMEGEKKYSPPLGTTHCVFMVSSVP